MAKLIRDRSTPEQDAWWSAVQDAAKTAPKLTYERSATMASDDVLERAEDWLRTGANHSVVGLIHDLAAEVRELRKDKARLDWLDSCEVTLVLHGPHRTSVAARDVIDAAMGGERTDGE